MTAVSLVDLKAVLWVLLMVEWMDFGMVDPKALAKVAKSVVRTAAMSAGQGAVSLVDWLVVVMVDWKVLRTAAC